MSNTPTIYSPDEFDRLRRLFNEQADELRSLQTLHESVWAVNMEQLRDWQSEREAHAQAYRMAMAEIEKLKKLNAANIGVVGFPLILLAEDEAEIVHDLAHQKKITPRQLVTEALHIYWQTHREDHGH